jgi:predicted unusual protein kinase regulating ubiquinone biosynthesis (AarF/ABC1/UbiB family)
VKEVPRSAWARSRAVVGLAANIARKEIQGRLRDAVSGTSDTRSLALRIEQAKLLAESLGRLKGAMMKAGQLLSIDAGEFLPPEVLEVLAKLQSEAEPVDFAALHAVLVEELGDAGLGRLEGLSEQPAASASIGQVYRARVDGTPVAVKVQYPGVAESIDSDLAVLGNLGQSMVTLSGRKVDLSDLIGELGQILHFEADYERERAFMESFRSALADDERFAVPRAFPSLSTKRVLTMSWEEGCSLTQWIAKGPSMAEREAVGRMMLDLFCLELFTWGMVQTDPNFGNFLIREMPGKTPVIVLLDFGATVEFDAAFRQAYRGMLRTMASKDGKRMLDEGIAFGLIDPREGPETRGLFVEMLQASYEPFHPTRQPFAFRDPEHAARTYDVSQRFMRSLVYSPPPRQLIFLHRKLGGIFQLLKRLDLTLDLRPYWTRMVEVVANEPTLTRKVQ